MQAASVTGFTGGAVVTVTAALAGCLACLVGGRQYVRGRLVLASIWGVAILHGADVGDRHMVAFSTTP